MKPAAALVLGIVTAFALGVAHAQVYQWKDASGRTVVSDTPPPGSAGKEANVIGNQPPAVIKGEVAGDKPADAPKSLAEQDLEFKKRQQEKRDKNAKDASEQKADASRKENCERARRNLAAIESGYGVSEFDAKGERKMLDESQRKQEMERYRQFIAQSCQ